MGDPTSSYATTGIALRVSGALKSHHHDKMETPSVGSHYLKRLKPFSLRQTHDGATYKQITRVCVYVCTHVYFDIEHKQWSGLPNNQLIPVTLLSLYTSEWATLVHLLIIKYQRTNLQAVTILIQSSQLTSCNWTLITWPVSSHYTDWVILNHLF
jgi:hypothetical protein